MCQDFKSKQKKYPRVRTAYNEKEQLLTKVLKERGVSSLSNYLFIRAFKKEQIFQVWVKPLNQHKYIHLKDYPFCSTSGKLGPKRKEGDLQIPEGFYHINHISPYSAFYLALGINYPNRSDRILSDKQQPGGDIYIHGACCTIGCIPLTDDKIKEVYVLAVEARNAGQKIIPVHIFPSKMDKASMQILNDLYKNQPVLLNFWKNLQPGYDYFEKHKIPPKFSVDKKGAYVFTKK